MFLNHICLIFSKKIESYDEITQRQLDLIAEMIKGKRFFMVI